VLHIGPDTPADLPVDVPTISEQFTPDHLLMTVAALLPGQLTKEIDPIRRERSWALLGR